MGQKIIKVFHIFTSLRADLAGLVTATSTQREGVPAGFQRSYREVLLLDKLVRFTYDRFAAEEAYDSGLPLPEPKSVKVLGDAEYDEYDLSKVAGIFYREMKELGLF